MDHPSREVMGKMAMLIAKPSPYIGNAGTLQDYLFLTGTALEAGTLAQRSARRDGVTGIDTEGFSTGTFCPLPVQS